MSKFHDDAEAGHREHAPPLRAGSARGGAGHLIVDAGKHDCVALATLHATAFTSGWSAASIAALLDGGAKALMAGAEGFIMLRAAADEAEILTLAVAPVARRQGRAEALLSAAMARARENGAATMFLEVSAANTAARALYEKAGFRETGRRARYYEDGADALLLARTLA